MGDIGGDRFQFYVHNRFLEILAENGFIGIAILSLFTLAIASRIYRQLTEASSEIAYGVLLPAAILFHEYLFSMFSTDLGHWSIGVWTALIVSAGESSRGRLLRIAPESRRVLLKEQVSSHEASEDAYPAAH
jgi:O-antigen ligase